MNTILSAADLVISRAGAGAIAEIVRCRTPSILIPYPYAADDHQTHNAKYLVDNGAAFMMQESSIKAQDIANLIDKLYSDRQALNDMAEKAKMLANNDATNKIIGTGNTATAAIIGDI